MTTYFVSRHSGAVAWAAEEGLEIDKQLPHLDTLLIHAGDIVIGSLPVHLVEKICARHGRYFHLILEMTPDMRGKELTVEDMHACHARLEEFKVNRC